MLGHLLWWGSPLPGEAETDLLEFLPISVLSNIHQIDNGLLSLTGLPDEVHACLLPRIPCNWRPSHMSLPLLAGLNVRARSDADMSTSADAPNVRDRNNILITEAAVLVPFNLS